MASRTVLAGVAAVTLAAVLAACSGGDEPTAMEACIETGAQSDPTAPPAEPPDGMTVQDVCAEQRAMDPEGFDAWYTGGLESSAAMTDEERNAAADAEKKAALEATEEPVEPEPVTGMTREDPYQPGETFELTDWKVTLGKTDTDATERIMQAEADELYEGDMEWATPPEEGHVFVAVPVTATYIGADRGDPAVDLTFAYVTDDGNTHDALAMVSAPEDFHSVGELYTDATGKGEVVMELPEKDVEGGVWRLIDWDLGEAYVATGGES